MILKIIATMAAGTMPEPPKISWIPCGRCARMPQGIQLIFGGSGIVPAAIVAIIFNIILPKDNV